MNTHRIAWKSMLTGHTGRGEYIKESDAREWVKLLNEKHASIILHWVEKALETTK